MKTIALHLERLHRHYGAAVRTYDHVSFLDLSHSLRIWVELKQELPAIAPAFRSTMAFKTAIPAKKVLKAAKGYRHVFCYMPGGVITYGTQGHLASGPEMKEGAGDFSAGIAVKVCEDHVWLNKFCVIGRSVDQPLVKALEAESVTRCNYVQWLASEAVRVAYPRDDGSLSTTAISREMIVKRVANTLDGSHPSLAAKETDNTFDPAVHHLLQYQVGGLPLPYFVLLKVAQDLLAIAPKLLGFEISGAPPNNSFKPNPLRGLA
jgi:hypothetical protein